MIDVHDTPMRIVLAYQKYLISNWAKVKKAFISQGHIQCELHNGIVVEADSPEELEEKLK